MKKVLITGGCGSIGRAFIDRYRDEYQFTVVSRNESLQHQFKLQYPDVETRLCCVMNQPLYFQTVSKVMPDIVIHAAAMKHVQLAQTQPQQAIQVNLQGSLNVLSVSQQLGIPLNVLVSTDKASEPTNVYGMTKYLMERCAIEADTDDCRVAVCRFGNVAWSNGSVIPYWFRCAMENKPLPVTDPLMNRLMFSKREAAELIHKAIVIMNEFGGGFIITQKMKTVNMLDLAKRISDRIEIVGIRPGERLEETLIGESELPFSEQVGEQYVELYSSPTMEKFRLTEPYSTLTAPRMTDQEIENLLTISV